MASAQPITYLSGAIVDAALGQREDFGILLTPLMGNRPAKVGTHAHDNGVWSEFAAQLKGKSKPFNLARYLAHLDSWVAHQATALFAPAPDVVGDWQATLARSRPVLPMIRERGFKAALVAQDGAELDIDSIPWDEFDVLFLGGGRDKKYLSKTNRVRQKNPKTGRMEWVGEWKLTPGAARLTKEARRRGKGVHMGRVNSLKRLRAAQKMGCTSADGTKIAFGPDIHTPTVQGWLDELN